MNYITSHFHGVPDFRAIGKPIAVLAFCSPSLNSVQCVQVKPCIVGYNFGNVILCHVGKHGLPDFIGACHLPLSAPQVCHILRNFLCIISGVHQFPLIHKNITIDERLFLVDATVSIYHAPTAIVHQYAFAVHSTIFIKGGVCRFGVKHQNIVMPKINFAHSINPFCQWGLAIASPPDIIYYSRFAENVKHFFQFSP